MKLFFKNLCDLIAFFSCFVAADFVDVKKYIWQFL